MTRPGGHGLVVDVAGLPVQLVTDDAPLAALLEERYRAFVNDALRPAARLSLEVFPRAEYADQPLLVQRGGDGWSMARGDFSAEWNPGTGEGRVRQVRSIHSTDSVLRIVHSLLLNSLQGLLLHASGVVRDARAWLFTGPSGAGKTTISRMAPAGSALLSDELTCVRRMPSGWRAFGTPYAGELGHAGEPISAPLGGIFRLVQGRATSVGALSPGEAVATVMRNTLSFSHDPQSRTRALDTACALAGAVAVRRLTFARDPSMWDVVR